MRFRFLALALVCGGASAQWASISYHPDDKGIQFYVDIAQSEKTSTGAKVAHLVDHTVPQLNAYGKPYLSERTLVEYDCPQRRARSLTLFRYSKKMGQGDIVASFERGMAWTPFTSDMVAKTMEEMICGK